MTIKERMGKNGFSFAGLERMATDLDISVDTVRRSVRELQASGLIIVTPGPRGRRDYKAIWPTDLPLLETSLDPSQIATPSKNPPLAKNNPSQKPRSTPSKNPPELHQLTKGGEPQSNDIAVAFQSVGLADANGEATEPDDVLLAAVQAFNRARNVQPYNDKFDWQSCQAIAVPYGLKFMLAALASCPLDEGIKSAQAEAKATGGMSGCKRAGSFKKDHKPVVESAAKWANKPYHPG